MIKTTIKDKFSLKEDTGFLSLIYLMTWIHQDYRSYAHIPLLLIYCLDRITVENNIYVYKRLFLCLIRPH